mmetsp:Transcript_13429/g.37073  ORF Transcript_13429/g.37073 Transcript_13429/m.37073 type:complete len:95 (+) Transcript_13429:1776-2060(+)
MGLLGAARLSGGSSHCWKYKAVKLLLCGWIPSNNSVWPCDTFHSSQCMFCHGIAIWRYLYFQESLQVLKSIQSVRHMKSQHIISGTASAASSLV